MRSGDRGKSHLPGRVRTGRHARRVVSHDEIAPAALADLDDNDNNHRLCLGTADPAVSVAFPAGHLVDPNRDLNPDAHVAITHAPRVGPQ